MTALYAGVLGRSADAPGLAAWQMALNQSGVSRSAVAADFLNSAEATRDEVIAGYEQLLGRTPDPTGGQSWVKALTSHSVSQDQFAEILLASDEFFALSM